MWVELMRIKRRRIIECMPVEDGGGVENETGDKSVGRQDGEDKFVGRQNSEDKFVGNTNPDVFG